MSLNSLAWSLTFQYQAQGLIQDLEESISLGRESLALQPINHRDRYETLDTLAKALHFKSEHLDEALQLSRESFSLTPPTHPGHREVSMNLTTILLRHYESSGSVKELQEATSVFEEALSPCPPNHYLRPKLLRLQAELAEAKSSSPYPSRVLNAHHPCLTSYMI
jgi:tetratricopeptide (TPR) repeat protein